MPRPSSRPGGRLPFLLTSVAAPRLIGLLGLAALLLFFLGATSAAAAPGSSYAIQAGDTLYGIATKLGITEDARPAWVTAEIALTTLSSPDLLVAGQSLVLPTSGEAPSGSMPAPASASSVETTTSYKVQAGDTLAGIAISQGISETAVTAWVARV